MLFASVVVFLHKWEALLSGQCTYCHPAVDLIGKAGNLEEKHREESELPGFSQPHSFTTLPRGQSGNTRLCEGMLNPGALLKLLASSTQH